MSKQAQTKETDMTPYDKAAEYLKVVQLALAEYLKVKQLSL
jgi:hypothetical protein